MEKVKLPKKIKVFFWLVARNSNFIKDNLNRRGRQGNVKCLFCNNVEIVEHPYGVVSSIELILVADIVSEILKLSYRNLTKELINL
jgi:hypothetical protein